MIKKHIGLFLILSFPINSQLFALNNDEKLFSVSMLAQREQVFCDHSCKHNTTHNESFDKYRFFGLKDDVAFISRILIRAYQILISSQDQSVCMFEPSCSAFAFEAIHTYGLRGVFLSADRISRCNSVGAIYYNKSLDDGRFKDPSENYLIY